MGSRLFVSLEQRIAQERDPLKNACLRAEKATLLARKGLLDQARAELEVLHTSYDGRPNAMVSAWISLAEGLVAFFFNLSTLAQDKMLRALALSSAVQATPLRALSAAWLSHMNYLEQHFEPMTRNIGIALATATADHHSARARVSLVLAQAYHWSERFDLALPWYQRARQHANADGDEATLSALMHNMAWLRAAQARRLSVTGTTDADEIRQILAGAESTGHFDERVGTATLGSLVPILRAHVLVLHERYPEALVLFSGHLKEAIEDGLGRLQCAMLADIAWCRVNTGDSHGAQRDADNARNHIAGCVQADERAAAHGRLAQLYSALGDVESTRFHAKQARNDWNEHTQRQTSLVSLLSTTVNTYEQ